MQFLLQSTFCRCVLGAVCVTSCVFHIAMYRKFTPVYTATECGDIRTTIDNFTVGWRSLHLGMLINVTCINPNPYAIRILDSNPGRVFVISGGGLKVGDLRVLPGSQLPQQGNGTVMVRMNAEVTGAQADSLVPHFLIDAAIPILLELQFGVGVSTSFGLGSWGTRASFKKKCGMNMAGVLVNRFVKDNESSSRLGPLICRDSFDFEIPEIGDLEHTPSDGQAMGFSAAQVAPDEVRAGELAKTVSLSCMILFSLFGAIFAAVWPFGGQRTADDTMRTLVRSCGNNDARTCATLQADIENLTPSPMRSLVQPPDVDAPMMLPTQKSQKGVADDGMYLQALTTLEYSRSDDEAIAMVDAEEPLNREATLPQEVCEESVSYLTASLEETPEGSTAQNV